MGIDKKAIAAAAYVKPRTEDAPEVAKNPRRPYAKRREGPAQRSVYVGIRITPALHARLTECAERNGISLSQAVARCAAAGLDGLKRG